LRRLPVQQAGGRVRASAHGPARSRARVPQRAASASLYVAQTGPEVARVRTGINLMCAVICFGTLLTTGCASITRGTKDVFSIQTDPPGATASMSNGLTCVTPCTLELPRKHGFTVTLTLDGYKSLSTSIVPRQAGAGSAGMAGNVIFG